MKFVMIRAEGLKTQFVTENYKDFVLKECSKRGSKVHEIEVCDHPIGIDLPGMISANRTFQSFSVDGAEMKLPTTEVEHFYLQLKTDPHTRNIKTKHFSKMYGWLGVIVLEEEQRDRLLIDMEVLLPKIKDQAKAERDRFLGAIKQLKDDGYLADPPGANNKPTGPLN